MNPEPLKGKLLSRDVEKLLSCYEWLKLRAIPHTICNVCFSDVVGFIPDKCSKCGSNDFGSPIMYVKLYDVDLAFVGVVKDKEVE